MAPQSLLTVFSPCCEGSLTSPPRDHTDASPLLILLALVLLFSSSLTLQWSTDIDYWLEHSLPIGPGEDQESYPPAAYQNQTTALILGGKNLTVEGHGYGTFDGNGQAWYDFVDGESNYPSKS